MRPARREEARCGAMRRPMARRLAPPRASVSRSRLGVGRSQDSDMCASHGSFPGPPPPPSPRWPNKDFKWRSANRSAPSIFHTKVKGAPLTYQLQAYTQIYQATWLKAVQLWQRYTYTENLRGDFPRCVYTCRCLAKRSDRGAKHKANHFT